MSKKYLCPNKHIIDEVPVAHKEDFLSFKCSHCSKEGQCDYVCSDIECLFLLCFDCYILEDDWKTGGTVMTTPKKESGYVPPSYDFEESKPKPVAAAPTQIEKPAAEAIKTKEEVSSVRARVITDHQSYSFPQHTPERKKTSGPVSSRQTSYSPREKKAKRYGLEKSAERYREKSTERPSRHVETVRAETRENKKETRKSSRERRKKEHTSKQREPETKYSAISSKPETSSNTYIADQVVSKAVPKQPERTTEVNFSIGQTVECKDNENDKWQKGEVVSLNPILVKPFGWNVDGFEWQNVRPIDGVKKSSAVVVTEIVTKDDDETDNLKNDRDQYKSLSQRNVENDDVVDSGYSSLSRKGSENEIAPKSLVSTFSAGSHVSRSSRTSPRTSRPMHETHSATRITQIAEIDDDDLDDLI